jgi:hypothetical protein
MLLKKDGYNFKFFKTILICGLWREFYMLENSDMLYSQLGGYYMPFVTINEFYRLKYDTI